MPSNKALKSKSLIVLPYLIIFLGVFIAYINVYNNAFLWDDEFLIVKNAFIRSFKYVPQIFALPSGAGANRIDNFYRPLQIFLYLLIYKVFGLNTTAFHFFNVLLHALNAVLLYHLLKRIFKGRSAFLTAFFWGIHPVHTEAVTYMSGTADPLSFFFVLLSFLSYLYFRKNSSIKFLIGSFVFFAFALLSKESVIVFPFILVVYELYLLLKKQRRIDVKGLIHSFLNLIPLFVVSILYFILRLTVLNFGNTLNFYSSQNIYAEHLSYRIYTFMATLPHYLSFIFYPVNLHMERSFPVFVSILSRQVLFPLILTAVLFAVLFYAIRTSSSRDSPCSLIILFGISWFFVFMIPFSGVIPVNAIILEHWLYIPSVGILLSFFVLLSTFLPMNRSKNVERLLILCAFIILISLTMNQNNTWRDPVTFYNHILKYEPGTARIHNNLAMAYEDLEELDLAEEHYLKAIQIDDSYAQTRYNLARLYLKKGRIQEAIENLNKSIEINPSFFYSYYLLSQIYRLSGRIDLYEKYLKKAQELKFYHG